MKMYWDSGAVQGFSAPKTQLEQISQNIFRQ